MSDSLRPTSAGSDADASSNRSSMVLYDTLPPPQSILPHISSSSSSVRSSDRDSKYPGAKVNDKMMPYVYAPVGMQYTDDDDDDILGLELGQTKTFPWRGVVNVSVLFLIIAALLFVFIFYPIIVYYHHSPRTEAVVNNVQVNMTGQVPEFIGMSPLLLRPNLNLIFSKACHHPWTKTPRTTLDLGQASMGRTMFLSFLTSSTPQIAPSIQVKTRTGRR